MNCIIVDDNELAIDSMSELLKHFCEQVQVAGSSQTIKNAVKLILNKKPDIVFLDVEMNNESGFDLFAYFPEPEFLIVFTTSHEQYAIKAFKTDCFDYLLKPISPDELKACINRIEKEKGQLIQQQREEIRISHKEAAGGKRIALIHNNEYEFIEEEEIVYFKAEGQYTKILINKKATYTSTKNIGEIEKELSGQFFRCHKSYIINLKYVTKYLKDANTVLLLDDVWVEISSRKKEEFLKLFNKV